MIYIEEKLGHKVGYEAFEPTWMSDSIIYDCSDSIMYDRIKLQEIAKHIASFLGLNDYCFIVSVVEQKENVAGEIQLNFSGTDVFIEITPNVISDKDAVVAVLAHEITHKYMQLNGIIGGNSQTDVRDHEILTDITCVFLGFGKLLLNGYRKEDVTVNEIDNGTHYSIKTKWYGYLNTRQLAFIYILICTMRKTSKKQMLSDLTKRSKQIVRNANADYGEYFENRFHTDAYRNEIISGVSRELNQVHDKIEKNNEHLKFIKEKILKSFIEDVREKTSTIHSYKEMLVSIYPDSIYDPALKFLKAIKLTDEINKAKKVVKNLRKELKMKERELVKLRKLCSKTHKT